ncbi:MAG: hypothetical protein COV44_00040 [Deltaproteobacteria bacterium CG11_big_fil_rev_8_21_14_0_20_45_16]|nr:MAG: hypothetical protein COV44_00040 [Deltaproteobacteria bacterium CG11_big_fil_rev_8_21_14_0_20_45_16]
MFRVAIACIISILVSSQVWAQNSPKDKVLSRADILSGSQILYVEKGASTADLHAVPEKIRILEKSILQWSQNSKDKKLEAQVRLQINALLNLSEVAKKALGVHWKNIETKPELKQEYVLLFSKLVEDDYMTKLSKLKNIKFGFVFLKPMLKSKNMTSIRIVDDKTDAVALLFFDSEWNKIVEAELDSTLLSEFYGQSFLRIIRKADNPDAGLSTLVTAMKRRMEQSIAAKL